MDSRCLRELGYVPYRLGKRLNERMMEFFPLQEFGYDRHQLSAQECDKLKVRLCYLLLFAVIHLRKVLVGIQC